MPDETVQPAASTAPPDLDARIDALVGEIDSECERVEANAPAAETDGPSDAEEAVLSGGPLDDELTDVAPAPAPEAVPMVEPEPIDETPEAEPEAEAEPEPAVADAVNDVDALADEISALDETPEPEPETQSEPQPEPDSVDDLADAGVAQAEAETPEPAAAGSIESTIDAIASEPGDHIDADSLADQVSEMLDAALEDADQTNSVESDDGPPPVQNFGDEIAVEPDIVADAPDADRGPRVVAVSEPVSRPEPGDNAVEMDDSLAALTAQLLEGGLEADLGGSPDPEPPMAKPESEAEPVAEPEPVAEAEPEDLDTAIASTIEAPEEPVETAEASAPAPEKTEPMPAAPAAAEPKLKPTKGGAKASAGEMGKTVWVNVKRSATVAGVAAAPVGAKAAIAMSKPLDKTPDTVRHTIGWLAMYTCFLAVCVWSYVLVFRKPNTPVNATAPMKLVESDAMQTASVEAKQD